MAKATSELEESSRQSWLERLRAPFRSGPKADGTGGDNGRLRRKLIWLALCGAGGLLLWIGLGFAPTESVKEALAFWLKSRPGLEDWLKTNPWADLAVNWLAAPLFVILVGWACFDWADRRFLNRWLGGKPDFLLEDPLSAIAETALFAGYDPAVFVGRDKQLASLRAFVGDDGSGFAWRMVTGRTGIGKTRLCARLVEDLARAARGHHFLHRFALVRRRLKVPPPFARQWDAGFLDPRQTGQIADWQPRRSTLLVLDEASRTFGDELYPLLATLAAKSTRRRPVRVLVIDHLLGDPVVRLLGTAARVRGEGSPLALEGLSDPELKELASHYPGHALPLATLLASADGSPRSALYMLLEGKTWDYREAIRQWANAMIPGLAPASAKPSPEIEGEVAEALVAAALIGPVDIAATTVGDAFALAGKLRRFFPDSDPELWRTTIPAFAPRDLGYELAFRLFDQMSAQRQDAVGAVLLGNPQRLRASLHEFWRERCSHYSADPDERLFGPAYAIQQRLDAAEPEVVEKIRRDVEGHFEALTASRDRTTIKTHLAVARAHFRYRPFDAVVLKFCLRCEINASLADGMTGAFDKGVEEQLTHPLIARWLADPEVELLYFQVLVNLAATRQSRADIRFLHRVKAAVESKLKDYRGGEDEVAAAAMRAGLNLIRRFRDARLVDQVIELAQTMTFAIGRAKGAASRDFELNYATALLNVLGSKSLPGMSGAAYKAAEELYELATSKRWENDPDMQVRLLAGLMHAMNLERRGPESQSRKWKNRLERLTGQITADGNPDFHILACHVIKDKVHEHAVVGRFVEAEETFRRLTELCQQEAGGLRWDCQGALMKARGCLSGHYASFGKGAEADAMGEFQLKQIEVSPDLTKEMIEYTVLGDFSDLAEYIDSWHSLNDRSAAAGKWDRFLRSMAAWNRFFAPFAELAKSSQVNMNVLGAACRLLNCARRSFAQNSPYMGVIRQQAFELYRLAPHDPAIAGLAQELGVHVNRAPPPRLILP
ncbi:ATP-binding protein [Novosphingobium sp.]|uniref:ATP-binding protein n=1 Tax=Novosphingobium sp. TaxID=1874826 RepID=UPI001EB3B8C5|nr:ATP-binding protein [Novosphingobium sp.]MBK6800137.1 ATP-binding protein [Novosphingobium sp.]MBK9010846.1 ATP-binding protein [Novosphingobium sp.]